MNQHRDPGDEQQTLDQLHPCPTCKGKGRWYGVLYGDNHQAVEGFVEEGVVLCRVCFGTGHVNYDPDDHTVFPY